MQPARSSRPRFLAAESPSAARRGATATVAVGLCVLGSGCFLGDVALSPPDDSLYYPTALVRSPGGSTLYVANSDFDLQYDGGTVLALDLVKIRTRLLPLLAKLREIGTAGSTTTVRDACNTLCGSSDQPLCNKLDLKTNTNTVLNPGPCLAIPLGDAVLGTPPSGTIGAFASGAIFVRRSVAPAARLFLPVRGDPSITFFDVNDDTATRAFVPTLDCTGTSTNLPGERCNNLHRIGVEPFESSRAIILPTEPIGIAASEDGTAIVVAHQTEKSVSLTIDDPGQNTPTLDGAKPKPTLEFVLGSLPDGPTDVATVPIPALFRDKVKVMSPSASIDYQRGFLISYRAASVVDLVRVHKDESGTSRPFLTRSNETTIVVNADGKDSRGIAIDNSVRDECEKACTSGDAACQLDCLKHPLDIFIANRTPPSLLVGRIETSTIPADSAAPTAGYDRVFITDSIPLAFGAAKVVVGKVIDPTGKLSRRVFAGAFDSKRVFSYDPQAHRVDAIFSTGRGPQALAFDTDDKADIAGAAGDPLAKGHSFLIVGHFTDSYLGVVDLDMRYPQTFGTMFASVGTPTPPKASK
jgi:DNA-binding beta-propeller fold protein YncE